MDVQLNKERQLVITSGKGLYAIDGYNNLDQLKEINHDVTYESNNVIFKAESDKKDARTILIGAKCGNQLHSRCISDPNSEDHCHEVLEGVESIRSLVMSPAKDFFYALAVTKNDKKQGFEIHKFKFTQNRSKPFERIDSVQVEPENEETECNRMTTTIYT